MSVTRAHEHILIRLALGGDHAAAAELVREHQASLFGYLVRLSGRRDIAEEVVQEAFVRALQHLERFDFEHRFSTWLFTIARRVYWNRSSKRSPSAAGDALEHLSEQASRGRSTRVVEEGLQLAEERSRDAKVVQAALLELTDVQREVLLLFHQLEWPISTIALVLALPEGTVKSHLHRARNRLRELIAIAHGDVTLAGAEAEIVVRAASERANERDRAGQANSSAAKGAGR